MHNQAQDANLRPKSPETFSEHNNHVNNGPDAPLLPEDIQFEERYSIQLLRNLQNREEDLTDSRNARKQIMKDADLPLDQKGIRIQVANSLAELEEKNLITLRKRPTGRWDEIIDIVPTEIGRAYELPPEEKTEEES